MPTPEWSSSSTFYALAYRALEALPRIFLFIGYILTLNAEE
jgi:hypothetical protein